jgi:hypothetical protein
VRVCRPPDGLGQRLGLGDRDQQAGGQRLVDNRLAEPCRGVGAPITTAWTRSVRSKKADSEVAKANGVLRMTPAKASWMASARWRYSWIVR